MRCPHCGRIVAFPSKEMGPAKREEFERFVDAWGSWARVMTISALSRGQGKEERR
jgi:hypothetical protein